MNRAKHILRWIAGIGVGIYLALVLLPMLPIVQRWMAHGTAQALEKVLDTRVEVGRIGLGWNGRIVVDDLAVWDQQQEEMLHVTRVAARISIGDLLHRRIRIGNAQLFGLHANLYQDCPQCPPNFRFLIEAFASRDTTTRTPLDLRISQILVRRGHVQWTQRWKSVPATISPAHLDIADLNITAQLNALTDDSLNVHVRRLDFIENHSGLKIKSLSFFAKSNKGNAQLQDFLLEMPHSSLRIPSLNIEEMDGMRHIPGRYRGTLDLHLSPSDLTFILPQLTSLSNVANLHADFHGAKDHVDIEALRLQDEEGRVRLIASGWADGLALGPDSICVAADITQLYADLSILQPYLQSDILQRMGRVSASGNAGWAQHKATGHIDLHTQLGNVAISGNGDTKNGAVQATVKSEGFHLGDLLAHKDLDLAAFDLSAQGHVGPHPDLTINGRLPVFDYRGYRYRNIDVTHARLHDDDYTIQLGLTDPNAMIDMLAHANLKEHRYNIKAEIQRMAPNTLNLTTKYIGTSFSGELLADVQGREPENMAGMVQLNRFSMEDSTGVYRPGDIHITSRPRGNEHNILLISPFLEGQIQGDFKPHVLMGQIRRMVSQYLPTIQSGRELKETEGQASFTLRAYNMEPLHRLLDIPLSLDGPIVAYGEMDSKQNALWMNLSAPGLQYGKEHIHDISLRLESNYEQLLASVRLKRQMKGHWVDFGLNTQGEKGTLTTNISFNNGRDKEGLYTGDVNIISRLWQDAEGRQGFEGKILSSNFIIRDTLWTVHPGHLTYYNKVLQIDSFAVSQKDRFIRLNGRASALESDTLHAQLQRINLEYIFSLINFHAVELTGEATGHAYAHSLFSSPHADAYIHIPQFALNYGPLGNLDIHINWGQRPYSIYLDGNITDLPHQGQTLVQGYITPKKDIDYHGIDLNVQAQRVNLYFINKWTEVIFDDLEGRATGWVHIFGPFKQLNIEGDAIVNEASVGIPFIGVRYRLLNDSVQLRPDNIYFHNARLYDPQGAPNVTGHSALVSGRLHHNSFKDLTYDINIDGNNILGYNFTDFADMNFYGTVYATGKVGIQGSPGNVRINIQAHPERGTTFTYNATSPDKLTETPFITYRPSSNSSSAERITDTTKDDEKKATALSIKEGTEESPLPDASGDLHIDFDLDIDEQSTMNLLMDARAGDKIAINGSGHMLAHYYNKGSFDLFGTYRVSRGTYNLSLQEIIHKKFEFSSDGTITFNGEPYGADLNLQAVHTVNSVSLNDINPKANFSNATTRVNCLMNIGGKARAPRITFDFDIPNANEDEKQMVRSLISTEEERNMQVIYLLGIGRFYVYDYANDNQTQGTTAMNSLLSSTLSGTINQALSNMMGTTSWNFGTNLRTGVDGWNDMDVEGMLQGRLLNNRLLLNGNFGYRDNPVATSNFIGDFDVKYLLTRSGTVALKAYSETNDRYFTKSSLTTQGIGILLKKDFTSWRDLMTKRKRKDYATPRVVPPSQTQ
ncbi:MAG: translocation/assembly module TamB domain-containing protein [Bacteroidaceae bacterium]|nr:translocation/assembly module TamB domain-containing protein [Bacteroidaceae bacterium]